MGKLGLLLQLLLLLLWRVPLVLKLPGLTTFLFFASSASLARGDRYPADGGGRGDRGIREDSETRDSDTCFE